MDLVKDLVPNLVTDFLFTDYVNELVMAFIRTGNSPSMESSLCSVPSVLDLALSTITNPHIMSTSSMDLVSLPGCR